ncbi:MAG: hypothetical protein ACRD2C_14780 [Acidimicrobiales bacterium]
MGALARTLRAADGTNTGAFDSGDWLLALAAFGLLPTLPSES